MFEGLIFRGRQVCKDFCGLIFADHQVECIVSLATDFVLDKLTAESMKFMSLKNY